jgi:hypothetical protein
MENSADLQPMLDRRGGGHPRGQVLPLIAFAIVSFFGMAALVIDLGYWRYEQRMQQAAADSGAIAGADEIPYASGSPAPIVDAAKTDTAKDGFADGVNGASVIVYTPPQISAYYAGNANAVEVIVKRIQPSWFSKMFGIKQETVGARAVALRGTAVRNCLYGLDTNGAAIDFNQATVNLPQCGIISNGNFLANNSTVTATSIGYVNSNQNIWGDTYPQAQPQKATPGVDPCPTLAGCAYLTAHPPTSLPCLQDPFGGYQNYNYNNATNLVLQPGRYCGGVNINPANNSSTLTFAPGLYDFDSGVNVNGQFASVTGNGVTFYINGGTWNLNGNPTMNLVAQSTGNYLGMLFYQPASNGSPFHINSGPAGPNGAFAGAMYLPSGTITIDGTISTWALIVAKDIILNSDSTINVPSSSFPGSTTRPSALVE